MMKLILLVLVMLGPIIEPIKVKPKEEQLSPEPPNSPNVWIGTWILEWGSTTSLYTMVLNKDGTYSAVPQGGGISWTGTWTKSICKKDPSKVEIWVSETSDVTNPEGWIHWKVLWSKKLPRKGTIYEGTITTPLYVGMRHK